MNVKTRQKLEKQIVSKTVEVLLAAGYLLSVNDGEQIVVNKSEDAERILGAMFTTDEDQIIAYDRNADLTVEAGSVGFIYGNDGYDVMNDHSMSLAEVLKPVDELIAELTKANG